MKRNVLIFGLILGALLAGHMVYMVNVVSNDPEIQPNDVVGYAAMIIVFSLTFFGIRNYRNKELGGAITFSKAFKTGALIALLGSTVYVVVWLFYYYLFVPDFIEKYSQHVIAAASREGATGTELEAKRKEMDQFAELYQNPLFVVLISFAEVLPVGLAVALVSSWILKRKSGCDTSKAAA